MAVSNIDNYDKDNDGMALPLSITRGNPNPLDDTCLWADLESAKTYAATSSVAYVGQILSVYCKDKEGNDNIELYKIINTAGDLVLVGGAGEVIQDDAAFATKEDVNEMYDDIFKDLDW